ncbi:SusC/RagA family TonB-linked outer membrane protein [Sphingobacterium puteale]|uniref:SusC/RagA family TonB-linked outer membrane protein n=1 Tax=Sphingobacterium puteale TaxID=2420510 RepID=UPI003D99A5E5
MVKNYTSLSFALFLSAVGSQSLYAMDLVPNCRANSNNGLLYDTVANVSNTDTIGRMIQSLQKFKNSRDTVNIRSVNVVPNLSLQQIVKGNLAGVYVQESSGEPGSMQSMIIQGASGPLFNKRDMYALQPAVYLNGVPLVQDNPFAFDIQKYDFNRIGPATNLFSQIDISNIQSIVVIKDPYELAKLGPNAANGAIYITTKNAKAGVRDISVNSYFGYATKPKVYTVNGEYENNFRKQFYQKYANQEEYDNYAAYLRDSTNLAYFGPSNWNDLYYKNTPTYSADLGIIGGSERASFRFFGSGTKSAGNADDTNLKRYNVLFGINMAPFSWLTVSSNVNAVRLDRDRNRSLRDRFAEARYIPDLSSPLSPNAINFGSYLEESKKSVDDNRTTAINGNLTISAKINELILTSSLMFDYNEGIRDFFVPSTLMGGISYLSNYFGYNQRLILNNSAAYKFDFKEQHSFDLELGQTFQGDTYKYNYSQAYNGPNDYVKLNKINGNPQSDDYLNALAASGFYVFRFIDKEVSNLLSFYGSAKYRYKDILTLSGIVRRDGASNGQPDSRWITSPSSSVSYNLKQHLLKDNSTFDQLNITAGWGRSVRVFLDDRYAAGPQYRAENGWFEEPTIPGYGPVLGINRPYESGFIGYGIKLPQAERTNLTVDVSFLKDRLHVSVSAYNRNDNDQVIGIPVATETGYNVNYKSGMKINNKGLELLLNGHVIKHQDGLNWNTAVNVNYNKNKVKALPDGLHELIVGDNRLEVGKSVGSFWLYNNTGIYSSAEQIQEGRTFNGISINVGDPIWADHNKDNRIDNKDKVMVGDRLPKFSGGWNNTFSYKNFDLGFNFIFAAGQKALNQYEATKYGFINREAGNDINSVKEVSSWQKIENEKQYPIYNPWSDVDPYRIDQDLFLENASYIKLRSLSIGYDLKDLKIFNHGNKSLRRLYLYATATNLLTISKFSGVDPELANVNGYYDGANLTIPKTFVLGFKLDL